MCNETMGLKIDIPISKFHLIFPLVCFCGQLDMYLYFCQFLMIFFFTRFGTWIVTFRVFVDFRKCIWTNANKLQNAWISSIATIHSFVYLSFWQDKPNFFCVASETKVFLVWFDLDLVFNFKYKSWEIMQHRQPYWL